MKTIIKLLIAVALINAVVRAGLVMARYYELKDEVQELVTFSADAAPNDIQNHIMAKAEQLQVPLNYDDVSVTRDGPRTIATASYTEPIEVFPTRNATRSPRRYWNSPFSFVNPLTVGV